jgi:hypothetical protein
MVVYLSPRVAAVAAGVVLVLGPIALIEVYRGLAAPAGAGMIMPASQARHGEPGRMPLPFPEAFGPAPEAASLFAPSSAGYRQTFSRPQSAPSPRPADARMFEFDAPAAFPPSEAGRGAARIGPARGFAAETARAGDAKPLLRRQDARGFLARHLRVAVGRRRVGPET